MGKAGMPRRRLIFLDIDGVICCNCSAQLEPARLAELQRIVRLTGAKIVLSTAWAAGFKRCLTRGWAGWCPESPGRIVRRGRMVLRAPSPFMDPERPHDDVSHSHQ